MKQKSKRDFVAQLMAGAEMLRLIMANPASPGFVAITPKGNRNTPTTI
jgi:hypothetical protein